MDHSPEVQRLIHVEVERLRSRSSLSRTTASAVNAVTRLFIRASRIGLGLVLVFGAYWLGSLGNEALDKPFAVLTLRDVAGLVFYFIGALVIGLWAFAVAFGEGPEAPRTDAYVLQSQAEATVLQRLERQRLESAEAEAEKVRIGRWYRYGKLVGLLFDPTLAKRHRWVPWVAALVGYGLLFAIIGGYMAAR
jgi:hypothetical protein